MYFSIDHEPMESLCPRMDDEYYFVERLTDQTTVQPYTRWIVWRFAGTLQADATGLQRYSLSNDVPQYCNAQYLQAF